MEKAKVSFPHMGNYHIPIRHLMMKGLELNYITPPPVTKRTLELGSKYSPDYVCAPFKICLGCYIEAIERGADTLIQVDGACRLGFYGELHEQILKDLGYDIHFVNLAKLRGKMPKSYYDQIKELNPDASVKKLSAAVLTTIAMVQNMDGIEDFIRQNIGFEVNPGSFEDLYNDYLSSLALVESRQELKHLSNNYMKRFNAIPVDKPENPLRVGVVGEYYSIMDPFANHYIEIELASMGIVIERWLNVTNSLIQYPEKQIRENVKEYLKYDTGATGMHTVDRALQFARKGYDGIIHMKSFGCTPEVDVMPMLQRISNDYKIPILYFSFDQQTADAGIQTRLEAFYDMMTMRKEAI